MKKTLQTAVIVFITLLSHAVNAQSFQLISNVNQAPDNATMNVNCSFREMNGKLYYVFPVQATGKKALFVSDGTAGGTTIISPSTVSVDGHIIVGGDKLYFFATDGTNGKEPWVSDGTASGTQMLQNINATTDDFNFETYSSNFLSADSSKAFFIASDDSSAPKLWVTDGTTLGTQLVEDVGASGFEGMVAPSGLGTNMHQGILYFFTPSGAWVSDGTTAGTFSLLGSNLAGGGTGTIATPAHFIPFNGKMYFFGSGSLGNGLWETDGTTSGTQLIYATSFYRINEFIVHNGFLYFTYNNGPSLYKSDGTAANTGLVAALPGALVNNASCQMTVANNTLFFRSKTDILGTELFKLDATDNIVNVKDIALGALNAMQPNVYEDKKIFQVYDNKLWFLAFTNITYPENLSQMWSSDGTLAGTSMVASPTSGWAGGFSNTYNIYATSFGMFMIYNDPITGDELYMYNPATGISEKIYSGSSVSIYPNPAKDFVTIISEETITKYQVFNTAGQSVTAVSYGKQMIDISALESGLYVIHLTTSENKTLLKRLIKE